MREIEYKLTYAEGDSEVVTVFARDISSGFGKALRARRYRAELASIAFWQLRPRRRGL